MIKLNERYKHVIWDWNGTLLSDQELSFSVYAELLSEVGRPAQTYEAWRSSVFFPIRDCYMHLFPDANADEISYLMKTWAKKYELRRNECGLHEYAEVVLEKLKNLGVLQSILSAHERGELVATTKELGVYHYFAEVFAQGLGNGGDSKVHLGKALLEKIESNFYINRNEHVIIGDSSHDAEVAKELGIDCILVAQGIFTKERLVNLGFPVLDSLRELL